MSHRYLSDATRWHIELPIGKPGEPCWHCGQPCPFVEFNFEAYLHPGTCTEAKWDEYFAALLGAARSYCI